MNRPHPIGSAIAHHRLGATLHRAVRVLLAGMCLLAARPAWSDAGWLATERAARARDAASSDDALVALGGFARALALFRHEQDPALEQRFLEESAASARSPIVRAHAGAVQARRLARAGDLDAALARLRSLGFIPAMRVLGPFANTGGAGFAQPLPVGDAASIASTQGARVAGRDRDIGWQTVPLGAYGELELEPRIVATQDSRVLLAAVITSPVTRAAALRLGSSGQLRAVLNGEEVLRVDADRPVRLDQSVAGVWLVRGENLIVIEAGFATDDARVLARVTDPAGAPFADLAFATDAEALARAARTPASKRTRPLAIDPVARAREATAHLDDAGRSRAPDAAGPDVARSQIDVRAAVDLEQRLRTGDRRARPRVLEGWLSALVTRGGVSAPVERASLRARLGDELAERQELSGARAAFEAALADDPACVEALLGLAALRAGQGDEERARSAYAAARQAMPASDLVRRRQLDFERRARDGALDIELAIIERAREAPTEENIALAADVLEDRQDMAAALELLARGADAQRRVRLRSRLLTARGADAPVDERLALAREALRLRPDGHGLAESLALLLVEAGRMEDARAIASERRRAYPERPEPLELAARLALLAGDRAEAREQLHATLAIVPQAVEARRTLRALEGDEDELVSRYGLDPLAHRGEPPPAQARAVGAHVEESVVAVRFFDNGLGRILTDKLFVVHDARKAAGLQTAAFAYSPGREQLDVLIAERIRADGRREPALRIFDQAQDGKENGAYSDVATRVIVFGQLADGDRIHVRVRKQLVGEQNLFGDFFGLLEPLQSSVPIRRQEIVVEAPLTRPLSWGGRGAPAPRVREETDRRVHEFLVEDMPALVPEPGMPPFIEGAAMLSVSTYGSWEEMGRWYEALVAPQLALNDELRRITRELVRAAPSEAERVRRIYEYVVTSTRYVGIELGIHGWKPYPVTEVHRRRYGDCKDKASLLVAMLREGGVAANIALVRTANVGMIAPEPPSMWVFNHAIAYVPSMELFLDGTAEMSGWRELPTSDQGALTLIVGAHGDRPASALRVIPVMPAEQNANTSDYVLTLDRSGALSVRGHERFRGAQNAEQRRDFADPALWRERLERQLSAVMPGARVASVQVDDLSLAAEETGYRFEATLPERAVLDGNGTRVMALSLYPHDLVGGYAEPSRRTTPVFVERTWRTRNVMRYVLPPGMRVLELPAGGAVESEHLRFRQIVTRTPDGFIVDEDTAVLSRRVPVEDYDAFRDAALRADALMKRKIRIVEDAQAAKGGAR